MKLDSFDLERIQSIWEHAVDYNLSESGIEPLSLMDIIDPEELRGIALGYPQTNGSIPLRKRLAELYHEADESHITVTNGGSEANMVSIWNLVHENKEKNQLVVELPNYMQIWGYARALGVDVTGFWLRKHDNAWKPDLEELKELVSRETLAITICNPNNPTGSVLSTNDLKAIAEIADDVGAWILSDEVYQGSERSGHLSPSLWGFYDKIIITSGLSKAYALPGLRIGWIAVKDSAKAEELWSYKDYTSIAPSLLSDMLATLALAPDKRKWILQRTREILNHNWKIVEEWLADNVDYFFCIPPAASGVCLIEYEKGIASTELAENLIREKSVLIAPGDYFLLPKHLRLGYGHDAESLRIGLGRITDYLREN